jgi:FeS assembly SUF system protein
MSENIDTREDRTHRAEAQASTADRDDERDDDREYHTEVTTPSAPATHDDTLVLEALEGKIVDTLKTVYDPEIPVDIYELGLIYKIQIQPDMSVDIEMTLTSPACPAAGSLPPEVEFKVASIPEVTDVRVEIVWDPPWSPDFMSEVAKLDLNMW